MNTTTRDALIAAVIAAPDDDVPRLVYADYLDEVGGAANVARAEFIRAEITAERLPEDDPERERLETRAARLFNEFGEGWNVELLPPDWPKATGTLVYRRGFVHEFAGSADTHQRFGRAFLAAAPIRTLRVLSDADRPTWSFGGGDLSHVTTFQFGPHFDFRALTEMDNPRGWLTGLFHGVFGDPTLTAVTHLCISGNRMNNAALEQLLAQLRPAPIATTLSVLDLSDNLLTDAGLAYLAAARGLEKLGRVHARGNPVTPAGIGVLRLRFGAGVIA